MAIVSAIFPPWQMLPISGPIRKELERRKLNYGINYVETVGNKEEYKGPRRTWIRCASNAIIDGKQGFRFINENDGFDNDYRFNGQQILGKWADGTNNTHTISTDTSFGRPIPGIISIDLTVEKSIYRKADIKWKCYSVDQLRYIGDYFFKLYSTVVLEWGWNAAGIEFLPSETGNFAKYKKSTDGGLILTESGSGLRQAFNVPEIIEGKINAAYGNYDAMIGHITRWDYRYESDLSFTCNTQIASNSRIMFGLSMFNLTKDSNDENRNPTSPFEYFKSNFEAELLEAIKPKEGFTSRGVKGTSRVVPPALTKTQTLPSYQLKSYRTGIINLKGRVFDFDEYSKNKLGSGVSTKKEELYITFGLFCEVLNAVFERTNVNQDQNNNQNTTFINIQNDIIGAHENMISTNKDIYLIPNAIAPFFTVKSIMDDYSILDKNTIDKFVVESPLEEAFSLPDSNTLNNEKLKEVYGANGARQNLCKVLTGDTQEFSFPQLKDDVAKNEKYKYGYIKDIFLNLKFIKTIIDSNGNKTLEDLLRTICNGLNTSNPFWKLNVVIGNDVGGQKIKIEDENYNNINTALTVKEKQSIGNNEPALYLFEPYTQNSIVKDFTFDARISDQVATQIINSINSKLNPAGGQDYSDVTDNDILVGNISDSGSFDRLIDKPKSDSSKKNDVVSVNSFTDKIKALERLTSTKNDEVLSVVKDGKTTFADVIEKSENLESPVEKSDLKVIQSVVRLSLPKNYSYLNFQATMYEGQEDFPNRRNVPVPQAEVSFTIEGIGGIKTYQIFGIKNLPYPYKNNVIFKIKEIKHTISYSDGWNAQIIAAIIPVSKKQYELLVGTGNIQ